MFASVLIANRGEIVARIARTAQRLGVATVAIASDADRGAPFTAACDQVVAIGGELAVDSYLRIDKIIAAATSSGAHGGPSRLRLPERARRLRRRRRGGRASPGSARRRRRCARWPTRRRRAGACKRPAFRSCPATTARRRTPATLRAEAKRIGYPLMVKAVAGGGGRGMRLVASEAGLDAALASAAAEANSAFGDARLLLERAVERARHVEIQVFADSHGNVIHLGERDCSLQRRHQKLVEEAPSPAVTPELRRRMGEVAVAVARAVDYRGAGTVEFLLDPAGRLPLHRDEHPAAGRARGHRSGARRRPRRVAIARRRRRSAALDAGRSAAALRARRPRHRGAALRRGSGAGLPAAVRPHRPLARRRPASAPTMRWPTAPRCRRSTTRCWRA